MGGLGKKKIWTGIYVVPPLILFLVWGPPFALPLVVLAATFLGLSEFYTLALPQMKRTERLFGIGLGLVFSAGVACGGPPWVPPLLAILILLLALFFMATTQNLSATISHFGMTLLGILYIGFLLSHISLVRKLPSGKEWSLFLIVTVWAGDVFAFTGGSLFGRHKLYPKISPKKTVEGLLSGVLGSILVSVAFGLLFLPHLEMKLCVLIAICLGILGQVGDFSESMLKRSAQVKDSGSLLPGHGGMLDRLDSFLFSSPFLYYLLLSVFKVAP
jgi:phosphatidate cytidylyltransferase